MLAAERAGYAKKSSHVTGHRLINNAKVAQRIREIKEASSKKVHVTIENVITELMILGFSDVSNICDWSDQHLTLRDSKDLSPSITKAIKEINYYFDGETNSGRVSIKMHDKNAALERLGKHLDMFKSPDSGKLTSNDRDEQAKRLLNQLTTVMRDEPCQDSKQSSPSLVASSASGLLGESKNQS